MKDFIKLAMEERYGEPAFSPEAMMQQVEAARNRQVKQRRIWMTGLCGLVLAASLGGFAAFQTEAAEYRKASSYLEQYGIDVEDMSRGVVKQVYKDIVTSTFELDSTKTILQNLSVQMDIILPERPSETELQAFWDKFQLVWEKRLEPASTRLDIEDTGLDGRIFTRYVNNEKAWEYHDTERFFDVYLGSYNVYAQEIDNGTLLYTKVSCSPEGALFYSPESSLSNSVESSSNRNEARLMLIDGNGELVWKRAIDFAEREPYFKAIFEKDGRLDIIGQSMRFEGASTDKYEYFLLTCSAETGELIQDKRTLLDESVSTNKVVDLGGQYLILSDKRVVTLSYDGVIGQFSQLESDGKSYQICDVLPVGDKFYISAELENMDYNDFCDAIMECESLFNLRALYVTEPIEPTPQQVEGLKEIVRLFNEQKNAVLLVLDESFQVERVVETPYSAAGKLKEENGRILQEIAQTETVKADPYMSAWPAYDNSRMVYQYTFDADGNFIEQDAIGIRNDWLKSLY